MSEQQFIGNTAPTLAGIKTGSLFPYHYSSKQEAVKALRSYNRRLTPKGLRLMPLRMTDTFAMLYLYRPGRLGRDLKQQDAAALLRQAGYPDCSEAACLRELRRRLSACEAFPHEIAASLNTAPPTASVWAAGRSTAMKPPRAAPLRAIRNARTHIFGRAQEGFRSSV